MAFQSIQNIDARHVLINNVGRDQYNIVYKFEGQFRLIAFISNRSDLKSYTVREDVLKKLEPVKMDPSRRTECLEGTRTDILDFIINWVSDATCPQNVLWVHGLAGSGKSTISTTVASHFRESNQLGAFLFFNRDVTEHSDPTFVVRTLAWQLGSFHPQIGELVSAVIERVTPIVLSPIPFQFQRLVVDPLSSALPLPETSHIVVVLDALDECGTPEDRQTLVNVLAENLSRLPLTCRTIITSRADADIQDAFQSQPHILDKELDVTTVATSHDISTYFRYQMTLIRTKKKYLGVDWPGESNIFDLTKRACGLFVWASTASKFIDGHDPRKRLDVILKGGGSAVSGAESALDSLYQTALESVGLWNDDDFVADYRAIIGMVLVLRNPLSSTAIDVLLRTLDGRPSISTITNLGCVVTSNPTVRIIHPSFADFLSTRSRCGRDIWFFQKTSCNSTLADHCLYHLNNVLRRNICNMTLSVDRGNESLPEDIAYACMFWIEHVCSIRENIPLIEEHLETFFNQHLLHWLEAMSILRARDTTTQLYRLLDWINVSASPFCIGT